MQSPAKFWIIFLKNIKLSAFSKTTGKELHEISKEISLFLLFPISTDLRATELHSIKVPSYEK